jgi:putative addiction module component (TIGR02574 family)
MSSTAERLLQEAMTLTADERLQLAEALMDRTDPVKGLPFHSAWLSEIRRRSRQIDSGEVTLIPWEEVKRSLGSRAGG